MFFISALAAWEIVEIMHHGSIFANLRARLEAEDTWISRLIRCPFCLTPWAALLCFVLVAIAEYDPCVVVLKLFVQALAAARVANVANDIFYFCSRTPKP